MAIFSDDFWKVKEGAWFFDVEGRVWVVLEVLGTFPRGLLVSCEGQTPRKIFWWRNQICGESGDSIEALNNPKTFVPKFIILRGGGMFSRG